MPVLDLKLDLADCINGTGNETVESELKVKYPESEEAEKAIKRPCDRAVKRPCDYIITPEDIPRWLQDRSAYSYVSQLRPNGSTADRAVARGMEQYVIVLDYVAAFLTEMQNLIHESLKLDESCEKAREALSNRLEGIRRNTRGSITYIFSLSRDLEDLIRPRANPTHLPPLFTRMYWEGVRRTWIEKGLTEEKMLKKCIKDNKSTTYQEVLKKVTEINIEEMETQCKRISREFLALYRL